MKARPATEPAAGAMSAADWAVTAGRPIGMPLETVFILAN